MKGRQYKLILYEYLLVLCIFAFCYKPYITADIYRLREYMEYWVDKPWPDILFYAIRDPSPAWILYSYMIAKLGDINWLQTITCFWCYANLFHIITHEIDREDIKDTGRGLLLFFIMAIGTLYMQAISGIRSMLGFSVIARCLYGELLEEKKILPHIPLYLIAALLHSTSMLLVIGRFAILVFQYRGAYKKILLAAIVLVFGAFALFSLRDFVGRAMEKAQSYLSNRDEYTYLWEELIGLLEATETVFIIRKYRLQYNGVEGMESYHTLSNICIGITVMSLLALPFSYAVFRRYTIFSTMICLPILTQVIKYEQEIEEKRNIMRWVWFFSLIIFLLCLVRGDLCGYKFLDFS